jgi:hypothetical protein
MQKQCDRCDLLDTANVLLLPLMDVNAARKRKLDASRTQHAYDKRKSHTKTNTELTNAK